MNLKLFALRPVRNSRQGFLSDVENDDGWCGMV